MSIPSALIRRSIGIAAAAAMILGLAAAPPAVAASRAAPVTMHKLLSAHVPSLCNHPSGTLVNGSLPIRAGFGFVSIRSARGIDLLHYGDLTGDGVRDAAVAASCSRGGVSWPQYVLLYTNGNQLLGTISLGAIEPRPKSEHDDVASLSIAHGTVSVTWAAYEGAGFHFRSYAVTAKIRAHHVALSKVTRLLPKGCPSAATLQRALRAGGSDATGPRDIHCANQWAVAFPDVDQNTITTVFEWITGTWHLVDRTTPCEEHEIPSAIYDLACRTN